MEKKTVLEQALLEAQDLEEAVKSNAKEILAATMKQEIEELVKESLTEEEEIDFDDEKEDLEDEVSVDELPNEEEAMVSMDIIDTNEPLDLTQASDAEVLKVFKAMGAQDGIVVRQDEDVIEIEDQEAGTEYKIELAENKLKNYPLIKEEVDDEKFEEMNEDIEYEAGDQPSDLEEALYEIELDDEEINEHQGYDDIEDESLGMRTGAESRFKQSDKARREDSYGKWGTRGDRNESQGYDDTEDESLGMRTGAASRFKQSDKARREDSYGKWGTRGDRNEASRTLGFGRESDGDHKPSGIRKGITNNRNLGKINEIVKVSKQLQIENRKHKEKNKEYRQALKVFRSKLNEVAVFNANLAFSTKLFTEHTTTKAEKINILRRFDNVKTLNESKSLYNNISNELDTKTKSLNESVQKTITKSPSRGSSINLIETKTYESPQISRMKEIMSKL
jgi:hypothetical protein